MRMLEIIVKENRKMFLSSSNEGGSICALKCKTVFHQHRP